MGSGSSKNQKQTDKLDPLSPLKIDLSKISKQKTRYPLNTDQQCQFSSPQIKSLKGNEYNYDKKSTIRKDDISKSSKKQQKVQSQVNSQYDNSHQNIYNQQNEMNKEDDEPTSPVLNSKNKSFNNSKQFVMSSEILKKHNSQKQEQIKNKLSETQQGKGSSVFQISKTSMKQLPNDKRFENFTTSFNSHLHNQNQSKTQKSLAVQHEFKTSHKIEDQKKNNFNQVKTIQQFSKPGIDGSYIDNNADDFGDEEGESLYLSLNSSEEEKRRENQKIKRQEKKQMKERQKISQQKISRKKIIEQDSIDIESYHSLGHKHRKHYQKEKFFIESLSQMVMDKDIENQHYGDKNSQSFDKQLHEDNQFGDCSSFEFNNDSFYGQIQNSGSEGRGVFGSKKRKLIRQFEDQREGINKEDVEANDSFDSYLEQNDNWTGDMTSKPRHKDKDDFMKITPFASPKILPISFQLTKYNNSINETQSVHPVSVIEFNNNNNNNNTNNNKTKGMKKIYVRSVHKLIPEKTGNEKQCKIEIVEQSNEDGQGIKNQLANKEVLYDYGICVHSKKGNSVDHVYNMSDYFVFIERNVKLLSLFTGHGAYGNFISNLASRLVFKHFFKEPLIKLQPQIGFKRLFTNVDKFISQHIIYYELEDTYNCMLSGACCTLVLVEQNKLFVASIGNTQAVVFRQQSTLKSGKENFIQLSGFHLPTNPYEKERIHKNAGEIRQWKNDFIDRVFVRGRTFPGIEVTRCFGNEVAKVIGVISEPDIYYYEVSKQSDQFLLVTSPNFYDYISYEEVYSILSPFNQKTVKKATEVLLKRIKSLMNMQSMEISDTTFILYYFF